MNEDDRIMDIYKKIEREKALINAANLMRQQTNNEAVRSKLDNQMRDGRRNLEFFEEKLRDLQMRRLGQGVENVNLGSGSRPRSADYRGDQGGPPPPPPKDASGWGGGGSYGQGQYSQIGQHGDMMPSQGPFPGQAPGSGVPKPRPNFTKLGRHTLLWYSHSVVFLIWPPLDLIKYDTPYLGPRIQLMLSQIQFKLNVEEQYLKGIEKMVQLYQIEGDKKSKSDAASKRIESKQKIVLLRQALRRYEELHIDDMESSEPDGGGPRTPHHST
jgi:hypothetical protein